MTMEHLRLLIDPPASGAWNMAIDEALMHSATERGQATLRFYQWEEPTLSLGYFQPAADRALHAASGHCPLVRRASGGGAILHDRELTYSLALPQRGVAAAAALYEQVHATLRQTLAGFGVSSTLFRDSNACAFVREVMRPDPFLCFQRRSCFDLVCHGGKIVGSAQRRRRGAVLQHGSILLAKSPCSPELPGIFELAGRVIESLDFATVWLPRLAQALGTTTRQGGLTSAERDLAECLVTQRFASAEHTERR
jgi:lipoate-protein ligase A